MLVVVPLCFADPWAVWLCFGICLDRHGADGMIDRRETAMPLSQLMPFNEHRFDACLAYLAAKHNEVLTQRQMVKLHVMIDVYHVLEHGRPVIGGALGRWDGGPVVQRAFNRVKRWWYRFSETGAQPENFCVSQGINRRIDYRSSAEISDDEFSPSELQAMEKAWGVVTSMSYAESKAFFHDPDNFMGRAWQNARRERRDLDWDEIIDAYDEDKGTDHSHIKTLIRF